MLGTVVFISKLCPVIVQKVRFYMCELFYLKKIKCLFYFLFYLFFFKKLFLPTVVKDEDTFF